MVGGSGRRFLIFPPQMVSQQVLAKHCRINKQELIGGEGDSQDFHADRL